MGKEWSWGGRSTNIRRAEKDTSGCMSGVLQLLFDFHQFQFPLHQPSFKNPNSFLPEEPTILKGLEAPRNSLESEEGLCMGTVPLSSITKEGHLNLPMAIRVGTKIDNGRRSGETKDFMEEISSETSTSPVTKTPNLVARLMGLDLLPESSSLSSSSSSSTSSKPHQDHNFQEKLACEAVKRDLRSRRTVHSRSNGNMNFIENEVRYEMTGSRSLPETPRISSARRSSDTDPRLSLQINKENLMIPPEEFTSRNSFSCSPYSTKLRRKELRQEDENRNPSYYARQIVKQVKDSIGRRKMGMDITNTTRNRASEGDSPTIKPQKTRLLSHTKKGDESSPGKHSEPSRSPRLRFLEQENKRVTATSTSHDQCSHGLKRSSQPSLSPKVHRKPKAQQATTKCKKGRSSSERFTQRLTKPPQISETVRNMRDESFVRATTAIKANLSDKNSKKTPLSSNLSVQKLEAQGSKGRTQLSSCLSQKYNRQEGTETLADQDDNKGISNRSNSSSKNGGSAEFRYVNGILRSTGIYRDAFVSITRWFSPYHILNPLIFHYLEHSFPYSKIDYIDDDEGGEEEEEEVDLGTIRHRCNRKLLFQLVDEILVDLVRPYLKMKPWLRSSSGGLFPVGISKDTQMTGVQLLERLWSCIQSFPAANCQILQDIDALVEKDIPDASMRSVLSYSEEGESIVFEIERYILDSLLHEIAAAFVFVEQRKRRKREKLKSWNG
ncbi:uncharacterized protein LOC122666012 [Telopea speciosissima]|uniref:uncharacterized protein LOC122666012 n=1 Tax=Telopea speciosissima TaxID=54955 RepID=UPI001CC612C4|nr:uncharacterized protein LOC122666012 [Telopea speciosissima]